MYEMKKDWAEYYKETEPQVRRTILDNNLDTLEDDGANAFRKSLFEARYVDQNKSGKAVDRFLGAFLNMNVIYQTRGKIFSGFQKEAASALSELCLDDTETLTELQKAALYMEYRNAAKRYFATSQSDRYGKKFMGTVSASDEEKREKLCGEAWVMSRGIALATKNEDKMKILCDAVYDELVAFDPQCETIYERLESEAKRR